MSAHFDCTSEIHSQEYFAPHYKHWAHYNYETSFLHEYSGAHLETETVSVLSILLNVLGKMPRTVDGTFCTCGGNDVTLLLTWGASVGKEDALQEPTPCALVAVVCHPRGTGLVTRLT